MENDTKPQSPSYRTLTPAVGKPESSVKPSAAAQVIPSPATEIPPPVGAKIEKIPDGGEKEGPHPDPTRFGDWEVKGRCIDF